VRRIRPADLVSSRPVWCLDLHHGGATYRVASEPIDVKAPDGSMHSYTGGLSPVALTEQLGRLKFTVPGLSATVRAVLPVSPAKMRARGHDWLGATAALYLTIVDERDSRLTVPTSDLDHSEMWLQVSGRVRSPTWGDPDDPPGMVEFTLEVAPWLDRGPLIPASESITEDTHAPGFGVTFPPDSQGKRYPEVFGQPGAASGTFAAAPGSPAYPLRLNGSGEVTTLLIARGWVAADTVTVHDNAGNTEALTVYRVADDLAQQITIASVFPPTTPLDVTQPQFFASWTAGNGRTSHVADGIRTAPQVAVYLLQRAGIPADIPAWSALEGAIPTAYVDVYVNDDSTAWDVLAAHVLPLMPVAYRYTRQGLAPVVYDPALRQADTVAHVRTRDTPDATSSGDWAPVGPMALETEPEDVVAGLDVTLAENPLTGLPRDIRQWRSRPSASFGRWAGRPRADNESGSLYMQQAATRGAAGTEDLTLSSVWDVGTADTVAGWRTRLASMPTLSAAYNAPLHWGWLQVGDSLTVTDPLREFDGAIGIIDSKRLTPGGWEFVVLFDEDPVRDSRVLD